MKSLRIMLGLVVAAVAVFALAQIDQGVRWNQQGVTFRTYRDGQHSTIEKPGTWVLNNQAEFEQLWPKLTGDSASSAPKDVKWNEERLVAVNLGLRNTGGFKVYVKTIERRGANVVVTYVEQQPGQGRPVTLALTGPWVIIRTPRIAGNYVFSKETVRAPQIILQPKPDKGCCKGKCGCTCCKDH